ncbi:hypothetical protein H257_15143 [Aphanomyces astaci]|uniref:Uncharacterized protein n=1 Tax=Aphanomyces astaci TaxID=112090 RepID=W4FQP1_APHAT|nr:hypothetical protein H257_15143 [Aphanomyces astaci]ETV68988.1 hypothetical protein H257_15143 [Aphanomyces astaci]|eukprot:XP_009841447.1 hypothetical protein H257_15143 [Aphanomyces astaci]
MHSLCAVHRDRANVVQRNYARRRRSRKRLEKLRMAASTAQAEAQQQLTTNLTKRQAKPNEVTTEMARNGIDPIPYHKEEVDTTLNSKRERVSLTNDDVKLFQDLMRSFLGLKAIFEWMQEGVAPKVGI